MLSDKELGMDRRISRRQFCQGTSVALGASLAPWAHGGEFNGSPEITAGYYPPAKTGLRGAHPGSFETAHALAHQGQRWAEGMDTGEGKFDLVIVALALRDFRPHGFIANSDRMPVSWCWTITMISAAMPSAMSSARGKTIIGYGGSQSIDGPATYSPEAIGLLKAVGVDIRSSFTSSLTGVLQNWPAERILAGPGTLVLTPGARQSLYRWGERCRRKLERFARESRPVKPTISLVSLLTTQKDFLPARALRKGRVHCTLSYDDYLRRCLELSDYLVRIINPLPAGLWGVGTDGISAREAMNLGLPGFDGLGVDLAKDDPYQKPEKDEPYIFHFPDGNAGLVRLIVRKWCGYRPV
jgi:spermidine dehydrogenase